MPRVQPTGRAYPSNAVIDFGPLPPGDLGAEATVQIMRALIHSSDRTGWPRRLAQAWCADFATPKTEQDAAQARVPGSIMCLWRGLKTTWTFRADPTGTEWTAHPDHFIAEIMAGRRAAGDCDDRATFTAALTRALGYTTVIIIAGRHPRGRYEHVYSGILLAGRIIVLDSQECARPGDEKPAARRKAFAV